MISTWIEQFSKYFYELSEEQGQSWIDDMENEWNLRCISNHELCLTIKDMVADKECPRRPTLRDIMAALRKRRKRSAEMQREYDAPFPTCALCGGRGLLSFSCDLSAETGMIVFSSVRLNVEESGLVWGHMSCPCACSRGQDLNKFYALNAKGERCSQQLISRVARLHRDHAETRRASYTQNAPLSGVESAAERPERSGGR